MILNDSVAPWLEACFQKIEKDHMQGMPVLNNAIDVQAIGFDDWQGRQLGVMITPWFMCLLLLPAGPDDWSVLSLGETCKHTFPQKAFDFSINEFEGIGRCQTHALHSPMLNFQNHQEAVDEAVRVLAGMMVDTDPGEADIEAERLRRFLDGDESALLEMPEDLEIEASLRVPEREGKTLSRRNLLRGGN